MLVLESDLSLLGIDIFHHLLEGEPPSKLDEALSSILVSVALASALDLKKKTFGMRDEVIGDIYRWRMAISNQSEKDLFDEVACSLWGKDPNSKRGLKEGMSEGLKFHWESFDELARELIKRSRGLYGNQFFLPTMDPPVSVLDLHVDQSVPAAAPSAVSPQSVGRFDTGTVLPSAEEQLGAPDPPVPIHPHPHQSHTPNLPPVEIPTITPQNHISPESGLLLVLLLMAGPIFGVVLTFLNCTYGTLFLKKFNEVLKHPNL